MKITILALTVSLVHLSIVNAVESDIDTKESKNMAIEDYLNLDKGLSNIDEHLYTEIEKFMKKNGMTGEYYIGSINTEDGWALISISKIFKSDFLMEKKHNDGSYLGDEFMLIASSPDKGKSWKIISEKEKEFKDTIKTTPDSFVDKKSKDIFTQSSFALATTINYKFPWQEFNTKTYSQGWHGSATPGLDFLSTSSDRRILSSAAGSITSVSVCTYTVNVTIKHSDGKVFKYLHLNKSEFDANTIKVGVSVAQGKRLGLLRTGSFSDSCGYAVQNSSSHHLHWGLPTNFKNTIDLWSITYPSNCWKKTGYSNKCVGSTFGSTNKEV